jgi:hypothetical protein
MLVRVRCPERHTSFRGLRSLRINANIVRRLRVAGEETLARRALPLVDMGLQLFDMSAKLRTVRRVLREVYRPAFEVFVFAPKRLCHERQSRMLRAHIEELQAHIDEWKHPSR